MAAPAAPVQGPSSAVPAVDSPRGPFASSTPRMESITQLHAAAVNGEKQALSRLIAGSGLGDLDVGDQFGRSPLMYCVLADRLECAELLLKAGAQVNFRDRGGRTALHWAAHKGNYRLMKVLLSRGADCREKDNEGQTALHLCTRHKLPKCMAMLLRQLLPGEIDDQDNNKRTALHWAASYGNLEHVKMLIKQDSNIGIPDTEGKTPLHWAASSRDPEAVQCVRLILETTPSVINWQDYEGRTALHLAVADGNQSIVDLLTSVEKCNVSALDNMFRTPLHWAAVLGHSKIVGQLLRSNADSTSSDSNGATPLHYAAQNNFDETVNVFLSWKNTDEPDLEGRTAFMWAAGKGADNVLRVFFHHKVDVQQEDKTGGTALHAAALSGHAATVQLLLQHSAAINATDQAKHTPLFRACEMGHTDVVQALIDCGARVDVLDEDGRSPLHWAALGGHAYICQILIKYGIDPNIRDHSGRTPLHCAAYGGYVNCMSALMEHQADPNTQDKEGMTCLHWACSKGHLDAVKLLVENNAFPNHMEFTEDRYTPLDYALMGEHHDVAQYMIEQGALSITGIQDIAATKIQSAFRGYRVRKTFIERKKLLMKHEMLKKEAARKRAGEGKKSEDHQKRDIEDTVDSPTTNAEHFMTASVMEKPSTSSQCQQYQKVATSSKKKKEKEPSVEEKVLQAKQEKAAVKKNEKGRKAEYQKNQEAAIIIQRAWRKHRRTRRYRQDKIFTESAQKAVRLRRLQATHAEWERQIAALTIQLYWRKFYRRKLLKSIHPNRRQLQMWDPEIVALKQQALIYQIYSEQLMVPFWHPVLKPAVRPFWFHLIPSPAAVSYNFAVDQYHPFKSWQGMRPHSWAAPMDDSLPLEYQAPATRPDRSQPVQFSYNLRRA